MNQDDIIRIAREAGFPFSKDLTEKLEKELFSVVKSFANLIAAAEREECAKVCADLWCQEPEPGDARDCYDAIRARGAIMYYAEKSPFELWREKHLNNMAMSPEIFKLIAEAFDGGRIAEREECAKVAENRWLDKANCTAEEMYEMQKKSIAEAIRARGQG